MTPDAFRTNLRTLRLTLIQFATLAGVAVATARGWGKLRGGRVQAIPPWVPLLLDAWGRCPEALAEARERV